MAKIRMLDGRCVRLLLFAATFTILSLHVMRNHDKSITRKLSRMGDVDVTQTQEINYQRQLQEEQNNVLEQNPILYTRGTISRRAKSKTSKQDKKSKLDKKSNKQDKKNNDHRDNIFYHKSQQWSKPSPKDPTIKEPTHKPVRMPTRRQYDDHDDHDDSDDYDLYYSYSKSTKSNTKDNKEHNFEGKGKGKGNGEDTYYTPTRSPSRSPTTTPNSYYSTAKTTEPSTTRLPTYTPVRLPTRSRNYVQPTTPNELPESNVGSDIDEDFGSNDDGNIIYEDDDELMSEKDDDQISIDDDGIKEYPNTNEDENEIENDEENEVENNKIEDDEIDDNPIMKEEEEEEEVEIGIGIEVENDEGTNTSNDNGDSSGINEFPTKENENEVESDEGTSTIVSWQYVLIAGVPSCFLILFGICFYQRWSKSKSPYFLDDKDGPVRVETIDGTTPLDNTGGYSQMLNSSNSQFNDSEEYKFLKDLMSARQDSIESPTPTYSPTQININDTYPISSESNSLEEESKEETNDEYHKEEFHDNDDLARRNTLNQHRRELWDKESEELTSLELTSLELTSQPKDANKLQWNTSSEIEFDYTARKTENNRYNDLGIDLLDKESSHYDPVTSGKSQEDLVATCRTFIGLY
ncbi:MAG: hypothetical protein ACI90V_001089 [Bacillariaceae sp.]|jgi:hypothetical protein